MRGTFKAIGRRLFLLSLSLAGARTPAQVFLGRAFNSDFAPSFLVPPFPQDSLEFWTGYELGIETSRGGNVVDLYEERDLGTSLGRRFGHWSFRLTDMYGGGAGRFDDSHSVGYGALDEHRYAAEIGYLANDRLQARIRFDRTATSGSVASNLISEGIPVLGSDPSVFEQSAKDDVDFEAAWRPARRWTFKLGYAPFESDGTLTATSLLKPEWLSVPIDYRGAAIRADAEWQAKDWTFGAALGRERGTGIGIAELGPAGATSTAVGPSSTEAESEDFGLQAIRQYRSGGRLTLHYENVFSADRLGIDSTDPNLLGYNLPGGATANASGSFVARRTEVGARWDAGDWRLSYRQVFLPFKAGGTYDANLFVLGYSQSGQWGYGTADLGVLDLARVFRLGNVRLTMGVSQAIPYALRPIHGVTSSSSGGAPSGPSSNSFGGTSLFLSASIPLK